MNRSHTRLYALGASLVLALGSISAFAGTFVMDGGVSVGAQGHATYSIPIRVVPGTSGMVPTLALAYSSQAGEGALGFGWALEGLSSVSRCPKTLATDGVRSGVTLGANTDAYCLEGQRLVVVSGSENNCPINGGQTATAYRTEIETFNKVCGYGAQGSGGHERFIVWTKAGLVLEYGFTGDARIEKQGSPSGTVLTWALNRKLDRLGNYIDYVYAENNPEGAFRIEQIRYTGNTVTGQQPYASVVFGYDNTTPSFLWFSGYVGGAKTQVIDRLRSITTYDGSTRARKYTLAYDNNGASERSRLTSVTECGLTDASADCLPPTTVSWTSSTPAPNNYSTTSLYAYGVSMFTPILGDFNGDGKSDVVLYYPSDNGWPNANKSILGFADNTAATDISLTIGRNHIAADFTADGKTDILTYETWVEYAGDYTPMPARLHKSNGDGTFTSVNITSNDPNFGQCTNTFTPYGNWVQAQVADLNADGHVDLVWKCMIDGGESGPIQQIRFYLGNGTEYFNYIGNLPNGNYAEMVIAADFNGDGYSDLYLGGQSLWLNTNTGPGGGTIVDAVGPGDVLNYWTPIVTDANGDGRADIFWQGLEQGDARKLWISRGDGTFEVRHNLGNSDGMYSGWIWQPGDFNGDGKLDFLMTQIAGNGQHAATPRRFWFSRGSDYMLVDNAVAAAGSYADQYVNMLLSDFTGDGKTDVAFLNLSNNSYRIAINNQSQVDLLSSVSKGSFGVTQTLTYKSLAEAGAPYAKGTGTTFPLIDIQGPMFVVYTASTDAGNAGISTTQYSYYGARADTQGRGFLGFEQVSNFQVMDAQNTLAVLTNYRQDYPYIGMPSTEYTQRIQSGGSTTNIKVAWNYYASLNLGGTRRFPYGATTVQSKWELDGAFVSRAQTDTTVDSWGNATDVVVTIQNENGTNTEYQKITKNNYDATDSTNWVLGRLNCAALTSYGPGFAPQTRTSRFEYKASGTAWYGMLDKEIIEPATGCVGAPAANGNANLRLTTSYGYDQWGNKASVTVQGHGTGLYDVPARTSTTAYDAQGRFPLTLTNPLGHQETRTWSGVHGAPLTVTTGILSGVATGVTTTYNYDNLSRLLSEILPGGSTRYNVYETCSGAGCWPTNGPKIYTRHQDTATLTVNVTPRRSTYIDKLDRPVLKAIVGMGYWHTQEAADFDQWGRITRKYIPGYLGDPLAYSQHTYDMVGRPVLSKHPPVSGTGGSNVVAASFVYQGAVIQMTDANGHVTTRTHDVQGRLKEVLQPLGGKVTYTYDLFDNLLTATSPGNHNNSGDSAVTTMTYDHRGRKTAMSEPNSGTTSYVVDALGQVRQQTDAKSQVTTFTFDLLGRPLTRTEPTMNSTYGYDTSEPGCTGSQQQFIGKRTRTSTTLGLSSSQCFNAAGLLTVSTKVIPKEGTPGQYITLATTRGYDSRGRLDNITYPSGQNERYDYAGEAHLTRIYDNQSTNRSHWEWIAFDDKMRLTQERIGRNSTNPAEPGSLVIRTYDNLQRTLTVKVGPGTGLADVNQSYTYDFQNNVTGRTWWDGDTNRSETFAYDALDRLTTVSGASSKSYSYDLAGNVLGKTAYGNFLYAGQATACPNYYAPKHGVLQRSYTGTTTYYNYDANGNLASETLNSCGGGTSRTFAWGSFNLPTQLAATGITLDFWYDADLTRARQVAVVNGVKTVTYYSGEGFERIESPGLVEQKYHVYAYGRMIASVNDKTGSSNTKDRWFYVADHLGSTAVILNAAGTLVEARKGFDAWGLRRNRDGTDNGSITSVEKRGYTNHEHLDSIGIIHMNGRVYDPQTGRFLSPDPILQAGANSQSYNRFAYVGNNPLTFTDPSGHIKWGPIIVAAVAAYVGAYGAGEAMAGAAASGATTSATGFYAGIGANAAVTEFGIGVGLTSTGSAIAIGTGVFAGSMVLSDGNLEYSAKAGLSAALFTWAGGVGVANEGVVNAATSGRLAAHAVAGCVQGYMMGGGCGRGAAAAVAGKVITIQFGSALGPAGGFIAAAASGGTASVIGKGKFQNGAITATYGYLFNQMSECSREGGLRACLEGRRGNAPEATADTSADKKTEPQPLSTEEKCYQGCFRLESTVCVLSTGAICGGVAIGITVGTFGAGVGAGVGVGAACAVVAGGSCAAMVPSYCDSTCYGPPQPITPQRGAGDRPFPGFRRPENLPSTK